MSCATCGHTMHQLARYIYWCPRCGTIKMGAWRATPKYEESTAPKLVARCREFEKIVIEEPVTAPSLTTIEMAWHRLGVAESIRLPFHPAQPSDAPGS